MTGEKGEKIWDEKAKRGKTKPPRLELTPIKSSSD